MGTSFGGGAMTILVASSDATLRRRLASWLAGTGHIVIEADNASSACEAITGKPDVIVVDWSLGGAASSLLLRGLGQRHRHYVVVYCAQPRPADITAIFAAGADDFIDAAAPREELLARIDGWTRRRSWTATIQIRAIDLDAPGLDGLHVWREIDSIVATELGETLGDALLPTSAAGPNVQWCGAITLTLPGERVALRFGVGLAADQVDRFAHAVLGGTADPDATADALRELANVAGGAIKRAASGDGVAITIGLPTADNIFDASGVRTWTASSRSGLRLALAVVATPSHARSIRCCELREGMVLASDIRNATGALLVAAGSCLTTTSVERLACALDTEARVDVSESAPLRRSRAAVGTAL
ncbi:MAG TPA: response regulator [Kofleriaceae bacterium]|jgi:CheY-like chemotaxis protein